MRSIQKTLEVSALASLACLCLSSPIDAEQSPGERVLLFAYVNPRVSPNNKVLRSKYLAAISNPTIDGVALIDRWNQLEPSPNEYEWDALDYWVGEAIKNKKLLTVGVVAGMLSPEWLFEEPFSVPFSSIIYEANRGRKSVSRCLTRKSPHPWDETYKSRFVQLLQSFANHLR